MAQHFDRAQIRDALALNDPAMSCYLDLQLGQVIRINETDTSPETETLRNQIMDGYGDRYRYIPGGKSNVDESTVNDWIEAEGL